MCIRDSGKGVAGDLELGGREGVARGGLRVDARGVVDKVGVEACLLYTSRCV